MYKIIIADDEIHILRLIRRFAALENTMLVGEATNGIDAYNLTLERRPDILITDIRMPGYNGIELIKKLKSELPSLIIIIISGYQDFEYAQEAIRFGVMEYLLKPIKESDVNAALQKAVKKIEDARTITKETDTIKECLRETSDALKEKHLHDFLFAEDYTITSEQLGNLIPELKRDENSGFYTMILKIDNVENDAGFEESRRNITENLCKKITDLLERADYLTLSIYKNDRSFVICRTNDCKPSACLSDEILGELLVLIRSEVYKYVYLKISLGVGSKTVTAEGILESFRVAEKSLAYRIQNSREFIFGPWNCPTSILRHTSCHAVLHDPIVGLKNAVIAMNTQNALQALQNIFDQFEKNDFAPIEIYDIARNITDEITDSLEKIDSSENFGPLLSNTLHTIDNSPDFFSIQETLKSYLNSCLKMMLERQEAKISRPVRLAQEYIMRNYDKQVTLEEVAETIYISPAYLSSLFKLKSGILFSEYVAQVKVEKAKEFLQNTSMNVNEIAYAVGYTDVKRFSKMFIRHVGIRPSEYRKFYSR